jgi:hypothetical protein
MAKRTATIAIVGLGLAGLGAALLAGRKSSSEPFNIKPGTLVVPPPEPGDPEQPPPYVPPPEPGEPETTPNSFGFGDLKGDDTPVEPPPDEPPPDELPDYRAIVDTLVDPYPTPGMFYQVKQGDTLYGNGSNAIIYRALRTAGFLAAKLQGLSDAEANTRGTAFANSANRRTAYNEFIQCSPWNDLVYGTWYAGSQAARGAHGRGVAMFPWHFDVRAQLEQGGPVVRNIDQGAAQFVASEPGKLAYPRDSDGRSLPFLWLPELDLEAVSQNVVLPSPDPWPGKNPDVDIWWSRTSPPPSLSGLELASTGYINSTMMVGCPSTEEVLP